MYNLTSSEGWYSANGLIVSNCDCVHVPASQARDVDPLRTHPDDYFRSLSEAEQNRLFGAAASDAIRSGTPMWRAVATKRGARSGLSTPRLVERQIEGRSRAAAVDALTRSGHLMAA